MVQNSKTPIFFAHLYYKQHYFHSAYFVLDSNGIDTYFIYIYLPFIIHLFGAIMKLLLIYNSHAGHKRSGKIIDQVRDYFLQNNLDVQLLQTEYRWHGMDLLEQTDLSPFNGLIAAGGDGTLFEIINGYYRNPLKKKPPIGLIPTGTGNAFARDLDLRSFEWKKAVDVIKAGKTRKVDVAHFKTEGKDFYYLNILGLGFVADVSSTAHHLKLIGKNAYLLGVFYQMARLNSFELNIELDGKKLERKCMFVEVSNTTFTGSTFLMAPDAKLDDGLLDVVIANKMNRRRLLKIFPTIFKGTHILEKELEYFQVKNIKIQTNTPKILSPDGELMGSTPVEIDSLPQAIEVFSG